MPKSLRTNQSVWTRVFRRIVQQVQNDPEIKRVFGMSIRSWTGDPNGSDKDPMEPSLGKPIVRLTPQPQNVSWYSESEQWGTLHVQVELAIASLAIDDTIDAYDLFVSALRPDTPSVGGDGGGNFGLDLVSLGAETGEIVFSDPAFDPRPDAQPTGYFLAVGGFRLQVIRTVNT